MLCLFIRSLYACTCNIYRINIICLCDVSTTEACTRQWDGILFKCNRFHCVQIDTHKMLLLFRDPYRIFEMFHSVQHQNFNSISADRPVNLSICNIMHPILLPFDFIHVLYECGVADGKTFFFSIANIYSALFSCFCCWQFSFQKNQEC